MKKSENLLQFIPREINTDSDNPDEYTEYTYQKDVSITNLYQRLDKTIYCDPDIKKCYYVDMIILNDNDPENQLTAFNKLLKEKGYDLSNLELWFRFNNEKIVELIDCKYNKEKIITTLIPEEQFEIKKIKDFVLNSCSNLEEETKDKIRNADNLTEINKLVLEELPHL